MKPTILAIIGKPLAGKDTQADLIVAAHPDAAKISTGHIIRDVAAEGEIHRFWPIIGPYVPMMEKGLKLPDEPTLAMLDEVIQEQMTDGKKLLVIAGSPRGLVQLEGFSQIADEIGAKLVVLHINVSDEMTYWRSGHRNEGRVDDAPEVHKVRLAEYDKYVRPVADRLRTDGKLTEINGMRSIDDVHKDIENHVISRILDPEITLPVMARR